MWTVYAITDQRCIIIAAPRRRTIQSLLAGPGSSDIVELRRVEDKQGRGDLVFYKQAVPGKRGTAYYDVGFIGVKDVQKAEVKVRELMAKTLSPCPTKSN